jgi:23S rRNA (cytidine1920-2'-O)/16S rRNA (cytidine1409-2'-O)-methyltransferase
MPDKRTRVDKLLIDRGLVGSRERARRLVMAGEVWTGNRRVEKPATMIPGDAPLEIRGTDIPYVSRGGLKLEAALSHWDLEVRGMTAVDIGASTGGFTDCLLQHGANHVFAIDVGYGQFSWRLRQDPRVTLFERANIRDFDPTRLPQRAGIAVIDVSFISLRLVLPPVLKLLRAGASMLALVKPQFEVGRTEVGKGGVVRNPALHTAAVEAIRTFGTSLGLVCLGSYLCPVAGQKGNREHFILFSTG